MTETAFVSTPHYTFPWPVMVTRPHPKTAGAVETQTFTGVFRLLDDVAAKQVARDYTDAAGDVEKMIAAEKGEIRKVLTGWEGGVVDAQRRPLAFSFERLEELMAYVPFRAGVLAAYREAVRARPAEGN